MPRPAPSNNDDVIDSRDIIARINELERELEDAEQNDDGVWFVDGTDMTEEAEELETLKALADEAEGYGDWEHGETLIKADHFRDWAEEFANDIGAVEKGASWPNNHIDWEAAAEELKADYMEVDFGGEAYYMRA